MVRNDYPYTYHNDEIAAYNRLAELDKLAREKGYSFNRSKLKNDLKKAKTLIEHNDDNLSESQRVKMLVKMINSVEQQMFGHEKDPDLQTFYVDEYGLLVIPKSSQYAQGWDEYTATFSSRKKKFVKPKPKRKVVKKCRCK